MAAGGPWACLYFITVLVLGRHLLLNVLVRIVVQTYQEEVTPHLICFSLYIYPFTVKNSTQYFCLFFQEAFVAPQLDELDVAIDVSLVYLT